MSDFHRDFLHLVALTGAWADADPGADMACHYRVAARNATGPGAPSATVPVTLIWQATDAPAVHDLAARGRDGHWYHLLCFGHADNGLYWCRR